MHVYEQTIPQTEIFRSSFECIFLILAQSNGDFISTQNWKQTVVIFGIYGALLNLPCIYWRDLWRRVSAVRCASYIVVVTVRVELLWNKVFYDKKRKKKKESIIRTRNNSRFCYSSVSHLAMPLAHAGVLYRFIRQGSKTAGKPSQRLYKYTVFFLRRFKCATRDTLNGACQQSLAQPFRW